MTAPSTQRAHEAPAPQRVRRVSPALHFSEPEASIGIAVEGSDGTPTWQLVTETGQIVPADSAESHGITLTAKPVIMNPLLNRWPSDALDSFKQGTIEGTGADAIAACMEAFDAVLDVSEEALAVLAVYAIGTYLFPIFPAFPYLRIAGEKNCGKTRVLEALERAAYNPIITVNATPAVIYRTIEPLAPTLLTDEAENLQAENMAEVCAVFNAGYKQRNQILRCAGRDQGHAVESFPAYCPKVLAAIKSPGDTIDSRAIRITMGRSRNRQKMMCLLESVEPRFRRARGIIYGLALREWRNVKAAYERLGTRLPSFLIGRDAELWRPLFAVAEVFDTDGVLRPLLSSYAREVTGQREKASPLLLAVMQTVRERLGKASKLEIAPGDLASGIERLLGYSLARPANTIGDALSNLGFQKREKAIHGYKPYIITAARLADLDLQYGPGDEGESEEGDHPGELPEGEVTQCQLSVASKEFAARGEQVTSSQGVRGKERRCPVSLRPLPIAPAIWGGEEVERARREQEEAEKGI